jgi:hypothetical protein
LLAAAPFRNMKTHVAFLAVSVLCLESAVFAGSAAAQVPAPPAEVAPPSPTPRATPEAPLPPPPPTLVDTPPPTPVHTAPAPPPAAPASPPAAPAPAAAAAPVPPVAPTPAAPSAAAAPSAPVYVEPAPVAGIERGLGAPRYRDAHQDRLLFAPTAETNPKGSFYATSYEIAFIQLGYALSDATQLSVTLTPPLGEAHVVPGDISVKTVLLREPHVSVAAIASASGIVGFEEFSGFLGRAGGVATFCVDAQECRLSFSMSSDIALIGPASLLFNGAGLSYRAGRIVSLIVELDSLIPLGEVVGEANGLLGGAGVRLSGRA